MPRIPVHTVDSAPEQSREAIALAVAKADRCSYCQTAHTAAGEAAGLSDEEMLAVRGGPRNLDPKLAALVTLVRELPTTSETSATWPGGTLSGRRVPHRCCAPGEASTEATTVPDNSFEIHMKPEFPVLYRVALTLTGSPADAPAPVQGIVIRASRTLDRSDGRRPVAWLLTNIRNTNTDIHRRQRPDSVGDRDAVGVL